METSLTSLPWILKVTVAIGGKKQFPEMLLDTPGIQKLTTIASSELGFYFFYYVYL